MKAHSLSPKGDSPLRLILMAEGKDAGKVLVSAGVGAGAGAIVAALVARRPAAAAPPDEKIDYMLALLEQIAAGNAAIVTAIQQLAEALQAIVPGIPEVTVSVSTPWVAKEPERILEQTIGATGTYYSDSMVNWTEGKRLIIKVESTLDQAVQIQLIGNIENTRLLATDVGPAFPCPANGNISIGLAWDDWHPYIGVRITAAVAPTAGILNIWSVIQE